jgi:NAD-dependent deacetylase
LPVDDECFPRDRADNSRVHVVWFGDIPVRMSATQPALGTADLFVVIGTYSAVYPAARFAAHTSHAATFEINLGPSDDANLFTARRTIGAVPKWTDDIPTLRRSLPP